MKNPKTLNADSFLYLQCLPGNLDKYYIRRQILNALISQRHLLGGTLLDVGCGQMPYKDLLLQPQGTAASYIGLDLADNPIHQNQPDIHWKDGRIPLPDSTADSAICTEVLEHCPNPVDILREIHRVLQTNGTVFVTVPFVWPLHEVPYDYYRYTPYALESMLQAAGFSEVKIRKMGGWDSALAQVIGLWVRRRPMKRPIRSFLSWLLFPLYRLLILLDKSDPSIYDEGDLYPALWACASKK